MRKILLMGLVVALFAVPIGVLADETQPDCEADQKAGSGDKFSERSRPLRPLAGACEGEQWDGQDTNSAALVDYRSSQAGSQPNVNDNGATDAVHVRASTGSGTYTRTDIFGVGAVGAYTSGTTTAVYLQDYSEDTLGSLGITDEWGMAYNAAHTAVYGSGHTNQELSDGNVLAGVVHFAHITQGSDFGEEDVNCTQADYAAGTCSRDNTAITVELLG